MKRTITLFLTLALTLLTSCELMAPGPTQRPLIGLPGEPAGTGGPTPAETGEPTPTETADPTVDEYGFTIFPEGNYLADPKFDTDGFLPGYDSDPSFVQYLVTHGFGLCRTDDTVYTYQEKLVGKDLTQHLIQYTDKATGISAPLCARPECLHNSSSCSAYMSPASGGLCVYDGKLYWLDGGTVLMRMNLDGTDRETVKSLGISASGHSPTFVIHRGYVYFSILKQIVVNGAAAEQVVAQAFPIGEGEAVTVLDRTLNCTNANCQLRLIGNDLYLMVYRQREEDGQQFLEFYRWDSKTRQVERLASVESDGDRQEFNVQGFWPVPGDGIYFEASRPVETGENEVKNQYNVYKYVFETGEIEEIPTSLPGLVSFTRNCFVYRNNRSGTVYAYDYDGGLILSAEQLGHPVMGVMGADDAFIYFWCEDIWAEEPALRYYIALPLDGGEIVAIE